jgi:sulfur relay (sulfurtransferase) DsrF/TusC family protein
MSAKLPFRLGLVVRNTAYAQRSARGQLDVALLAAAVDFDLHIYFLGSAVLQLTDRGDLTEAQLPAGYRAWASLPDLFERAELQVFVEPDWLEKLHSKGLQTCLPVLPGNPMDMQRDWARCDRLLTL